MSDIFFTFSTAWVEWTDAVWLRHVVLLVGGLTLLFVLRNHDPRVRRLLTIVLAAALFIPPLFPVSFGANESIPLSQPIDGVGAVTIAAGLRSAVNDAFSLWFSTHVIFLVWLLGAAAVGLSFLLGSTPLYRMARRAVPLGAEELNSCAGSTLHIAVHPRAGMPYVVAWPGAARVIVPPAWRFWSERERNAVLAHETAHVKQGDHYWIWLFTVLRVVFWWNPLVWLLARAYHHSAEMCCDDEARRSVELSAADYAQILLNFAKNSSPRLATAVTFVHRPSLLQRRILHQFKPARKLIMRKLLIAAVCVAALPLLLISEGDADSPASNPRTSRATVSESEAPANVASAEETDVRSELLAVNGPIKVSKVELKSEAGIEGGVRSLAAKMSYPKVMYEAGAEANVFLNIVVDNDGSIGKIDYDKESSRIVTGENSPEALRIFVNEAMKVVQSLDFYPAIAADGNPVKSQLTLPIVFKMPESGKVAPSRPNKIKGSSRLDQIRK